MILQINIPDDLSKMDKDGQEAVIQKMVQIIGEKMQNKADVEPSTFFTALASTIGFLLGANVEEDSLPFALETASRLMRHNTMHGRLARQKIEREQAEAGEPN